MAGLMSLGLFLLPRPGSALQTVTGNETAIVRVSNRDLNRFVAPHRLRKGFSNKPIEVTVDGNEAYVNIPPTIAGPVELHLLTERETYTLLLIPAPIPAETIVIRGGTELHPAPGSGDYIRQIKSLIRAAANHVPLSGYDAILIADAREECPVNECSLIAVWRYTGRDLAVTEYRLSNPTKEPRVYRETLFARQGTRAIAIEAHHVGPGSATRLFRVEGADR
ncbi:TraK domain-containing protein [Candidatus Manganitrophus noduliformans]|nr:type-F conjugative transfer system secretin TraK [Candidatus Manganitrophus noduliformans]